MSNLERFDPHTGEISPIVSAPETSLAVQLAQAELNQAVTTAKAFPRSVSTVMRNILSLATLDEETAAECVYALPRGGKPIKGPSVRLAEIIASQWGNCHVASRIVAVDKFEKVVIAEGVFLDLETGMKRTAQVQRRIVDSKGNLYKDDMIIVTGNAAASIAMREAVLKGVPKAIWRKAYDHAENVIAGDVKTLAVRRDDAIKAFALWGVKPEQIFASLEVEGLDDIGLEEIGTLTAMYKAIRSEEQTVEDYFPAKADQSKAAEAAKGTAGKLGQIAEQGKAEKAKEGEKPKADKPAGKGGAKPTQAPAEGGDKPAGETAAGGAQGAQTGSDAPGASDAQGEDDAGGEGGGKPTFSEDEIEAAFKKGKAARDKGMARKATPPELREPGKEPLLEAYLNGFDE